MKGHSSYNNNNDKNTNKNKTNKQTKTDKKTIFILFFIQKPFTVMQESCRKVALIGLFKTFVDLPTNGPFYKRELIDKLSKQQQH